MNREEILSKSRNENAIYDERARNIHTKSSAIAKAIGSLLGLIIVLIEILFFKHPPIASMAAFSVCYTMGAVESWYRFINLKGKFDLIRGILFSLFAIAFMVSLMVLWFKG